MISVAIAAYNGERFLLKQLESIADQTVPVDEVIICDDRSTDSTVKLARDFIKERGLSTWDVRINDKNKGFCLNYYDAISACSGDVIFLADQDDVWHPDKVEKMIACLENNPNISVLGSRYDIIDGDGNELTNSGVTYLGNVFDGSVEYIAPESLIGCSYIRGFCLCFKKNIAEIIKPIDLKSLLAHDWQICMLGSLNGSTAILNTKLTDYRYHGDNVSLSAMDKYNRVRQLEKRIRGLKESIEGHSYIASLTENEPLKSDLLTFISFEKKRLHFLETKNFFCWAGLVKYLKEYGRYYKDNGRRVWIGDLAYAYKK